jgi:hypothetical protein
MAVFMLLLIMFISFGFTRITDLLSLLGATSQVYLIFIVPIMLYVKAFELNASQKIVYYLVLFFVTSIGVSYLVSAIIKIFQ